MFVRACEEAGKFTRPVVLSTLRLDGAITTSLGAFVPLNSDGWVVTAGHIIKGYEDADDDSQVLSEYDQKVAEIRASSGTDTNKRTRINRLHKSDSWIRRRSLWWANDPAQAVEAFVYPDADLAFCRLEPFDQAIVSGFPVFKRPTDLKQGTSLVKVGFPFHNISATFNDLGNRFVFQPGSLPAPIFPMEGIFTRVIDRGTSRDGYPLKVIETSSPGLRGQSGGPTLDQEGVVWAIQTQTLPLPLGFRPKDSNGREEVEQFLNVGLGSHPETFEALVNRHGIRVEWAD
jgi:hypothetical protein